MPDEPTKVPANPGRSQFLSNTAGAAVLRHSCAGLLLAEFKDMAQPVSSILETVCWGCVDANFK